MPHGFDGFLFVFIASTGVMIAVAMVFLLPPLLAPGRLAGTPSLRESNLAIYRAQLGELEADLKSGTVDAEQYAQAKRELERQVVTDVGAATAGTTTAAPPRLSRRMALVVAIAIPILAALLYVYLGSPQAVAPQAAPAQQAQGQGAPHSITPEQIAAMVDRLSERLKNNPKDPEGWAMLARSYQMLGRYPEAVKAFANAAQLIPNDAQLLADYADATAMANDRTLDERAMKIVRQALQADPNNMKALALSGTFAFDKKDYATAISSWEKALAHSNEENELTAGLRSSIEEARALAGMKPSAAAAPAAQPNSPMAQVAAALSAAGDKPPAGQAPAAAGGEGRVTGRVTLSPELAGKVAPTDTVFVFARAAQGPRMPLAMMRVQVKDLPLDFVLDDSSAMAPNMKMSTAKTIIVAARVSKSGNADPRPGDLEGMTQPVSVGATGLKIAIDKVRQ